MISACKKSVISAYAHLGDGDEKTATRIADDLAGCGIRAACPYGNSCANMVCALKKDIDNGAAAYALFVGNCVPEAVQPSTLNAV